MEIQYNIEELSRFLTDMLSTSNKRDSWNNEDKRIHHLLSLALLDYQRNKNEPQPWI